MNWLDNNLPGNSQDYSQFIDCNANVFPNPFDYFFTCTFTLEEAGNVSLRLLSMYNGTNVKEVVNNVYYEKGEHKLVWEYNERNSIDFPNGHYIIILEVDNEIVYRKKLINK